MPVSLPEEFIGTYKLEKSENFDEYLVARGVNWFLRKMMSMVSVSKIFEIEEGKPKLSTLTPKKNFHWPFNFDEPFESIGFDDKKHRVTFRLREEDGKKVVVEEHVRYEESPDVEAYRYYKEGDYLVLEMEANDIKCKRFMKKQ